MSDASLLRFGLAFAIGLGARLQVAHADGPAPDVGVRVGFAEQTHYGGAHFVGSGFDLGLEAGVRVSPALTLRVGFERAPRIVHFIPAGSAGEIERRDTAIVGVAEFHFDPFFVGAGGGWVQESSTRVYWASDALGSIGSWTATNDPRSGQLVLARGGMQLGTSARLSVNLVMQLTAQRVTGPSSVGGPAVHEHAYGASLGMEIRGLAAATPSMSARERSRSWFVGADVGLMGALTGSLATFAAWDNAAPRAGLDVGGYVTPSLAIVLGAAGATHLSAGRYYEAAGLSNNQARLTLGAEAHHQTLFGSAGGGISRYTVKWSESNQGYRYDHTNYSRLLYVGGGVELPSGLVHYRVGGELSMFDIGDGDFTVTAYAFTLTFGIRLSNAR